jgi:CYTH domain-containing protein
LDLRDDAASRDFCRLNLGDQGFSRDNDGLLVAEVEIANLEDEVELPRWAGAEVSNTPRTSTTTLLRTGIGTGGTITL